jgi:hypothetical protein
MILRAAARRWPDLHHSVRGGAISAHGVHAPGAARPEGSRARRRSASMAAGSRPVIFGRFDLASIFCRPKALLDFVVNA